MKTNNNLPTIRCAYCKRIAHWVRPRTGVQVCSSCKDLNDREEWYELALRWLTNYPKDWAGDVAAFLEVAAERSTEVMEPVVAVVVCEGCNGSNCGSNPHRHRKVMRTAGVVAKATREKDAGPDAS